MLPILHLNGYKIANPALLARIPEEDLVSMLRGYGYQPYLVSGDDPTLVHQRLAGALDRALDEIAAIQRQARAGGAVPRPAGRCWCCAALKGWTGPVEVDGVPVAGTWRSHQVPLPAVRENPAGSCTVTAHQLPPGRSIRRKYGVTMVAQRLAPAPHVLLERLRHLATSLR